MKGEEHLGVARQLLRTHALVNEPKLLLACAEEISKALREAGVVGELGRELDTLMRKHRESPMEFTRKESYVICDEAYQMELLDGKRVSRYLEQAESLIRMPHSHPPPGGTHERKLFAGR